MNMTQKKHIKELFIGLFVIFLLIIFKFWFENTYYGHRFIATGYELLTSFIPKYNPNKELPVIVLDISDLKSQNELPPNDNLKEIIETLAENQPKAIAIDIDYSPPTNESPNPFERMASNKEFLEFLLKKKEETKIPIFVGVHNVRVESSTWFGIERFKELAAFIGTDDTNEVYRWIQCDENDIGTRLHSLSSALANATLKEPDPPIFLKPFLKDFEEKHNLKEIVLENKTGEKTSCQAAFTLVNYSKDVMIQNLTLQTIDKNSIQNAKTTKGISKFADKIVIIGNGQISDSFSKSDKNTIAGVFMHASAVNTLVSEPIYKFEHWASVILDSLLGLFIVLGLFLFRLLYPSSSDSSDKWENRFILASVLITIFLGLLLVAFYNVVWFDFILVIFALFFHPYIQDILTIIPMSIFKKKLINQEKN